MILADSSVWIDYFSRKKSSAADRLDKCLNEGQEVTTLALIVTEVLSGFREDKAFETALSIMSAVPVIPLDFEVHIRAAQLYRKLRKKGVTIRGPIDCLIAQCCLDKGAILFTLDRDFGRMSKETGLRLLG